MHVEAVNARNAELRRAADRAQRHRAPRFDHQGPVPQPRRRRARRPLRTAAAAVATRVAR
jgi:hypothetical protein